MDVRTGYSHTQRGHLSLLLLAVGSVLLVAAWLVRGEAAIALILVVAAVAVITLAAALHHLTISDEGDRLAVGFGPLPVFRTHILYDEIQSVAAGRTLLRDGWGIHLRPGSGWVWNIRGRDCVVIQHGGTTIVGTDDAANLTEFLRAKMLGELYPGT